MKFEDALVKLNDIIAKLESGELSLDESIKLYQEGIDLSAKCKKQIQEAKLTVNEYSNKNCGEQN